MCGRLLIAGRVRRRSKVSQREGYPSGYVISVSTALCRLDREVLQEQSFRATGGQRGATFGGRGAHP